MNLLLVFNPLAAGGRAARRLPEIRKSLEDAGVGISVHESRFPGHVEQLVRETSLAEFDGVAVAGGDGTLFQALNGLMAHSVEHRVPLGLIPVGTGNAFARDIGLQPDAWRQGIEQIERGAVRGVDVGRIESPEESFYFLNIAGFGFVAGVGQAAAKLKFAGRSAYTLATLWRCLWLRSHSLEMEVDGHTIREENLFVEVSNSRYTGTNFLIAPTARIDDGYLDITCVRKLSRFRLLCLFPSIFRGAHVEYDEVTTLQGRTVRVTAPKGSGLMVDGEFRGQTPVMIECLPGAVEVFAS